jgi:hypothetical protein
VAVDPDHARELGRLWSRVHIPFPLEVVDAPDFRPASEPRPLRGI